ncbi:MAG: hypothetical protein U5O16_00385 [Rhodococcus sp. (in: high G+C Gram-positive bacteria)]|uniref:hypothetical protein n=1 Tax=Rhodococcus sp. TaxID=1831 RepID=UPI002AD83068|nr:hypothetical protein [Rhodococcus sp. (in: high G+C Gram-positive bacteria)]
MTIGCVKPGPLFEIMVVLPAVNAIAASLFGALAGLGVLILIRRSPRSNIVRPQP